MKHKLFTLFICCTLSLLSQTKMFIQKSTGTDSVWLSDVKSIYFKTISQSGTPTVSTLLSNLEAPNSIWITGNLIYLTETAGRNTGSGGKICLNQYNITTGQKRLMINNPQNSDAVVASSTGKVYLSSYIGSIPGEKGKVSIVDTSTNLETPLIDIQIATEDMYIDETNDITIIGSSDSVTAKSLYLLPAINYQNPTILKIGLGRVWCVSKLGKQIYYSSLSKINCIDSNGTVTTFANKSAMSISLSSTYLYYADYFGGKIGRINLLTKVDEVILTNLISPKCLRYDVQSNKLYFIEFGSNASQYKNGTLKVISW